MYLQFIGVHFANHLLFPHGVHGARARLALGRELVALTAEQVAEHVSRLLWLIVHGCLGWFEVRSTGK